MDDAPISDDIKSRLIVIGTTYKIPIILGILSISLIVVSLVLLVKSIQTQKPIEFSDRENTTGYNGNTVLGEASASGEQGTIVVDIEGGVENPGVYTVSTGDRIGDVIDKAGGVSKVADTDAVSQTINRAQPVRDGGKIYIPILGENQTSHNGDSYERLGQTSHNLINSGGINVNLASESELDSLPGVGPVTVQKIIAGRPYATLDELVTKKAIGASLYQKIKDQLTY